MHTNISQRDFLKLTGLAGGTFILTACASGEGERSFLGRLQGIPLTDLPRFEGSGSEREYSDGRSHQTART